MSDKIKDMQTVIDAQSNLIVEQDNMITILKEQLSDALAQVSAIKKMAKAGVDMMDALDKDRAL